MGCYHFHLNQLSRGKGQSAIASAAYRAGTKLECTYYGEVSDYTRKGGVVLAEIHLPQQAPERFKDRETLWNEVEWIEGNKKAQLAHSFDIALMNEFSMEENIELARRFVEEQLVARGGQGRKAVRYSRFFLHSAFGVGLAAGAGQDGSPSGSPCGLHLSFCL